jgi:16S rRNA (uracil1498-N3)-methyltransferase
MKHVPHVVVAAPWPDGRLPLTVVQWRHLTKVLRRKQGEPITYTDGLGTFGTGTLGHQEVERGEEVTRDRAHELTVAVAPPSNKDRQRFLVEKLAELGVARLIWLRTRHGANRVSSSTKVFTWMLAAVEQSRGAWLMETSGELVELAELAGRVVVCHPGGDDTPDAGIEVVVIGPEGGFAEDEIPPGYARWGLGDNILRVETAAIAAVARLSFG